MPNQARGRVRPLRALEFIMGGILAGLVLIEVAVRVITHTGFAWGGPNSDRYAVWDPVVGRIPKPGLRFRHPKGFTITTGEFGTRGNGGSPPPADRPRVLAVGDSFAFGDQVDDENSWPAVLERLSGMRVINAGVPGFGLDQAVVRAEQLAPIYRPRTIIAAFIPHDILRCGMSFWSGRPKPYFQMEEGELRLHPPPTPYPSALAPLKRLLSFSVAMDLLFPRFLHWQGPEVVMVHQHQKEVACRLMDRLAELGREYRAQVVVVAQPQAPDTTPEDLEVKSGVLGCATARDLPTVDLFPVIDPLAPEQRQRLFHGHMTAAGNLLVAEELAAFLARDMQRTVP